MQFIPPPPPEPPPVASRLVGYNPAPSLNRFPELRMALSMSPKLVPATGMTDSLLSTAMEQATKLTGHIRVCDKNMGLCVAHDDWYKDKFRALVLQAYTPCEPTSMIDLCGAVESFIHQVRCYILYRKEFVGATPATKEQLKPAWALLYRILDAVYGKPDEDGIRSDTPILQPEDCNHLRLLPLVKIHKNPIALRPIVCASRHPVVPVSKSVSSVIWRLLEKIPNCVIRKPEEWVRLHHSRPRRFRRFLTADIRSFYTEITQRTARLAFDQLITHLPQYAVLFELLFKYFVWSTGTVGVLFAGEIAVRQKQGCVMGYADAPAMSQLIRTGLEWPIIRSQQINCNSQDMLYRGYIDDIIVYIDDTWLLEDAVQRVTKLFQAPDGTALFELEWDLSPRSFLACRFIGMYDTQFNIKPTGLSLVPWHSLHPRRYLRGAVIGCFTFAQRYASTETLFFSSLMELTAQFLRAHYPLTCLLEWLPLLSKDAKVKTYGWCADWDKLDKVMFTDFTLEQAPNARHAIFFVMPNFYCRLRGFNGKWDSCIQPQ